MMPDSRSGCLWGSSVVALLGPGDGGDGSVRASEADQIRRVDRSEVLVLVGEATGAAW